MQGLGKKLKREVAKSPAKSSVLGLVMIVAIWYWAPLIGSWLPGGSTEASETLVVAPSAPQNPVVPPALSGSLATSAASQQGEKRSASFKWQTVVAWLAQDFAARPARLLDGQRDPFQREKADDPEALIQQILDDSEEELEASESQLAAVDSEPVGLAELQLVLGGTIVGKRSSAIINGNAYQEGDAIPITVDGGQKTGEESGQTMILTLKEVQPRHVVIVWQGDQRCLEIERAKLASGDQIARSGETDEMSANVNSEN